MNVIIKMLALSLLFLILGCSASSSDRSHDRKYSKQESLNTRSPVCHGDSIHIDVDIQQSGFPQFNIINNKEFCFDNEVTLCFQNISNQTIMCPENIIKSVYLVFDKCPDQHGPIFPSSQIAQESCEPNIADSYKWSPGDLFEWKHEIEFCDNLDDECTPLNAELWFNGGAYKTKKISITNKKCEKKVMGVRIHQTKHNEIRFGLPTSDRLRGLKAGSSRTRSSKRKTGGLNRRLSLTASLVDAASYGGDGGR